MKVYRMTMSRALWKSFDPIQVKLFQIARGEIAIHLVTLIPSDCRTQNISLFLVRGMLGWIIDPFSKFGWSLHEIKE